MYLPRFNSVHDDINFQNVLKNIDPNAHTCYVRAPVLFKQDSDQESSIPIHYFTVLLQITPVFNNSLLVSIMFPTLDEGI